MRPAHALPAFARREARSSAEISGTVAWMLAVVVMSWTIEVPDEFTKVSDIFCHRASSGAIGAADRIHRIGPRKTNSTALTSLTF